MDNNPYSQYSLHLEMCALAEKYGRDYKEMFRPLILAHKVLTTCYAYERYEGWKERLMKLHRSLEGEDKNIVCKIIVMLYYSYADEIAKNKKPVMDDLIAQLGLDDVTCYNYYIDDEMKRSAKENKDLEFRERRIRSLMEIAESPETKPFVRLQAWREIEKHTKEKNNNKQFGGISDKKTKEVDTEKHTGQGTKEFRDRLKELDEIALIENEHDKS
jgi:hypothetical protein